MAPKSDAPPVAVPPIAATPAALPAVPPTPLLSPAPAPLIRPQATARIAPKRQLVDAFKVTTREARNARQIAKQTRDASSQLLSSINDHHDQLAVAIKMAEESQETLTEFAREGFDVGSAKNLQGALLKVLDEFMPLHAES